MALITFTIEFFGVLDFLNVARIASGTYFIIKAIGRKLKWLPFVISTIKLDEWLKEDDMIQLFYIDAKVNFEMDMQRMRINKNTSYELGFCNKWMLRMYKYICMNCSMI